MYRKSWEGYFMLSSLFTPMRSCCHSKATPHFGCSFIAFDGHSHPIHSLRVRQETYSLQYDAGGALRWWPTTPKSIRLCVIHTKLIASGLVNFNLRVRDCFFDKRAVQVICIQYVYIKIIDGVGTLATFIPTAIFVGSIYTINKMCSPKKNKVSATLWYLYSITSS